MFGEHGPRLFLVSLISTRRHKKEAQAKLLHFPCCFCENEYNMKIGKALEAGERLFSETHLSKIEISKLSRVAPEVRCYTGQTKHCQLLVGLRIRRLTLSKNDKL